MSNARPGSGRIAASGSQRPSAPIITTNILTEGKGVSRYWGEPLG